MSESVFEYQRRNECMKHGGQLIEYTISDTTPHRTIQRIHFIYRIKKLFSFFTGAIVLVRNEFDDFFRRVDKGYG